MYTQADHEQVRAQLRKRWLITAVPSALVLAAAIVLFVICQSRRLDWGWMAACCATVAAGAYFIFFYGVYVRPMALYEKNLRYMLDGRKRETTGILQEMAEAPQDKDGLDCYALVINVGDRNDPEDERLLYYDAMLGRPQIPVGARVRALSNDKMISDLREV